MTRAVPKIGEAGYERVDADAYRTPPQPIEALLDHVAFEGLTWECAAGEGDMSAVLRRRGMRVVTSDIRRTGTDWDDTDFLALSTVVVIDALIRQGLKNIITNPPYSVADDFVRRALAITKVTGGKVAMLLGHDYDTALVQRRWAFRDHPAWSCKIQIPRISWLNFEKKSGPRQIHAWFVWSWSHQGDPVIKYA